MADNLGIATVKVGINQTVAPHINRNPRVTNFDVSAHSWESIINSPFIYPLLVENLKAHNSEFSAIHPSKRKHQIHNKLNRTGGDSVTSETKEVLWRPLGDAPEGLPSDIKNDKKAPYDRYSIIQPEEYSNIPKDYKGPIWEDHIIAKEPVPDDNKTDIATFLDLINKNDDADDVIVDETVPEDDPIQDLPSVNVLWQKSKRDGLWWAIESNHFLPEDNTPFWIHFNHMVAPSSDKHDTCFIIRLGDGDEHHQYDIYLSLNQRPRLRDYLIIENSAGGTEIGESGSGTSIKELDVEWEMDLSRTLSSENFIEVGIMSCAGRLVIIVNGIPLIYTRIDRSSGDNGGNQAITKIKKGKIVIFGTNCQTMVSAFPMTFASKSLFAVNIPAIIDIEGEKDPETARFQGIDYKGDPSGCVAQLPTPPSILTRRWGVDCRKFSGDGGGGTPEGFGFLKKGIIKFRKASESFFSALPSSDFHTIFMEPDTIGGWVERSGCPYFFQLNGIFKKVEEVGEGDPIDISDSVVSVDETAQAPDYYHVKKTATITCYNEHNEIGDLVLSGQTGVTISWGWNDEIKKTFTGLVNSVSKSEIAGKETIILNCCDYMCVLNIPIMNSPYYDGMVAFYALKDLATRAGIVEIIKDWENENEYFLPSGYGFTKPKMRFDPQQMLFDCMMKILQRDQAFMFFDPEGKLHIDQNEGGLFAENATTEPEGVFTSNPFEEDVGSGAVILEERNVEISYDSTVNSISLMTLSRDTRNPIIVAKTATGAQDKLLHRKIYYSREAAFGELEAARAYIELLSQRNFNPILKTRFKVAGAGSVVFPLSFITVDGQMFKLLSVKRSFNAENNDMNCSYEGEWLFGE